MTVIRNNFHDTEVNLVVKGLPCRLSTSQVRRARRTLCGITGCTCGGPLGERGPQDVHIEYLDDRGTIGLWDSNGEIT